jgi:riboflavin synthase
MFTGLVEECVPLRSLTPRAGGARLRIGAPERAEGGYGALGESIAVSGVCLTLAGFAAPGRADAPHAAGPGPEGADLLFDVSAETLQRTTLGALRPGSPVNLERALRLGERLGGHLVTGHVDGIGTLVSLVRSQDGGAVLGFEVDPHFERWLVEKGSVAVEGVSLTVVRPEGRRFEVAAIPLTLERTSLGRMEPGQRVNLESDPIGKWVARLLEPHRPA